MNKKMSFGEFKDKLKTTDITMIEPKYRLFCLLVLSGARLSDIAKELDRSVSTLGGWMYKAIRNAKYNSRLASGYTHADLTCFSDAEIKKLLDYVNLNGGDER